ncbi:MAG: monovalent cation/H(+) antiporter subunit G [Gemmobacter sp.]|jgi:multicomponent K+:H+ antiporter subunit G|nr:monovalent cation/H(+) antiporter subunit G [Gemmobacter sp.]
MTGFQDIPLWIAVPVALFLLLGSTLSMLGAFGLMRLKSFYDRLHAPTLATSWGTAGIVLASILLTSWLQGRLVLHDLVIALFVMLTTPVTLMLLGRAALNRDRAEGAPLPPAMPAGEDPPAP